jgi:hypothetical protein
MPTTLETFGLNMLQPIQRPEDARQDACKFAASLTITKGQAIGVATATGLGQQLVPGASDGTQNFVGFSMYDFLTDANGKVFFSDSTGRHLAEHAVDHGAHLGQGHLRPGRLEDQGHARCRGGHVHPRRHDHHGRHQQADLYRARWHGHGHQLHRRRHHDRRSRVCRPHRRVERQRDHRSRRDRNWLGHGRSHRRHRWHAVHRRQLCHRRRHVDSCCHDGRERARDRRRARGLPRRSRTSQRLLGDSVITGRA